MHESKKQFAPGRFLTFADGRLLPCQRELVREEPLVIRIQGQHLATLMCTPGDERELAVGFLLTEGCIRSFAEIAVLTTCADASPGGNHVSVLLTPEVQKRWQEHPPREVRSSCGICTAKVIDDIIAAVRPFSRPLARLAPAAIFRVAEVMRSRQEIFARTGGTHAAALAPIPLCDEDEIIVREDLGRHNALDKAVGTALLSGRNPAGHLLVLSGRLSYEMVAKAARAGISDVAAVGAPSSLAVEVAQRLRMFVAGFVRGSSMTVYCGSDALAAVLVRDVGDTGA